MHRTTMSVATFVAISLLLAPGLTSPASAGVRANDWVEVWCDTDPTDGQSITLWVDADGVTHGDPDDALAKVVDASAFNPGMKDSNHFNHRAGVVLGWYCGAVRYADGEIGWE